MFFWIICGAGSLAPILYEAIGAIRQIWQGKEEYPRQGTHEIVA